MIDRLGSKRLIILGVSSAIICGSILLLHAPNDGLTSRQHDLKQRFEGWFKGWGIGGPPDDHDRTRRFQGDYTGHTIIVGILAFADQRNRDPCYPAWLENARIAPEGLKAVAAEYRRTCPYRVYIYGKNLVVVAIGEAMPNDPVSAIMRHGVERIWFTRIDGVPSSPDVDAEAKSKALKVLGLEGHHDSSSDACALC